PRIRSAWRATCWPPRDGPNEDRGDLGRCAASLAGREAFTPMEISKINSGLLCALGMAGRAIASLEKGADPAGPLQPFCDKVVAETAMLLLCANSAAATDPDVR